MVTGDRIRRNTGLNDQNSVFFRIANFAIYVSITIRVRSFCILPARPCLWKKVFTDVLNKTKYLLVYKARKLVFGVLLKNIRVENIKWATHDQLTKNATRHKLALCSCWPFIAAVSQFPQCKRRNRYFLFLNVATSYLPHSHFQLSTLHIISVESVLIRADA